MICTSHQQSRSKVLMLAYSCAPNRSSEPGVGWNWAIESAKNFDTWVITNAGEFANEIKMYFKEHGDIPSLHFTFVSKYAWARHFKRNRIFYYMFYNLWHRRAFTVARQLHKQIGFDLVHQINFTGYREPGYLWKLEAPFVWGPIGGTQNYPWRFLVEAGFGGAFTEAIRNILNYMQLRLSPRIRHAASRADILLAANSTNQRDFERVHRIKSILMLETGVHSVAALPRRLKSNRRVLHILWSGNLSPHKGLPLLLKALSLIRQQLLFELRILGAGQHKRKLQRLARKLGIVGSVTWLGWLPHQQVLEQYRWADVFVFTSLRDTSGNVVLEALAAGVPVICLDHQGVRDIVTEECGIKIPITLPSQVVTQLSGAIMTLAQDRVMWKRLSAGALQRARYYEWSRQGERMAALYRKILDVPAGNSKPPLALPDRSENNRFALRNAAMNGGKRAAGFIGVMVERVFKVQADEPLGILLYHRIAPHIPGFPKPSLNVTPKRFREQIAGLIDRGYVIRPLREILKDRALGLPISPRTVVVTFDDGFASVHAYAWPVLKEFNAAATVFLITNYLDCRYPFPFDRWGIINRRRLPVEYYRPLTSAECRKMTKDGLIELGSHTHTHQDFRCRPTLLTQDVQTSVDLLRKRFGLKEVSFAFPGGRRYSGHSGKELMAAVRNASVTCALTTDCVPIDWRSDPFGWGRFNVYQWDTATSLTAKLKGCYGWAPKLQEFFSLSFREVHTAYKEFKLK